MFAGAHLGTDPAFASAAHELGHELLVRKLGLVYGGSDLGLMGIVSRAVRSGEREGETLVHGFMCSSFVKESGTLPTGTAVLVDSSAALQAIAEQGDVFVVLPGALSPDHFAAAPL